MQQKTTPVVNKKKKRVKAALSGPAHTFHTSGMEKSRLYTGTGDTGMTSLASGQRVRKDSVRLEAYGTVDEFSSHLGLLEAFGINPPQLAALFRNIQNKLFNIGAYLATEPSDADPQPRPFGIDTSDIAALEEAIDSIDARLEPMRCFILPGGCAESAQAHVARTVSRRAERRILTLAAQSYVDPVVLTYFNRLSDLLFAVARLYNRLKGVSDVAWQK